MQFIIAARVTSDSGMVCCAMPVSHDMRGLHAHVDSGHGPLCTVCLYGVSRKGRELTWVAEALMVVTDMRSSACRPLDEEGRINSSSRLLQSPTRGLLQVPCHPSAL